MKYMPFKWYKIPKRGLVRDCSGVAILIKNQNLWYLSNAEVVTSHCLAMRPTHFMILPGFCRTWMGPDIAKFVNKNVI